MRPIRTLVVTALMATTVLALPSSASAATSCGSNTRYYQWSVSITQYDFDGTFRYAATASGTFRLTASGCWTGTTSYGTAVSWARTAGVTPTLVSGPGWYAFGGGTTDFWVNLNKTVNGDNGEWCRINMFPRIKLSKAGAWSTSGTTYSISENKNPFYTACSYQLST